MSIFYPSMHRPNDHFKERILVKKSKIESYALFNVLVHLTQSN